MIELPSNGAANQQYNDGMSDTLLDSMGARVLLLMRHQQLSGKELAEQVGVSAVFISQIVNQNKEPSTDVLRRLAKALHTTADYLLCLSDAPYAADSEPVRAYSVEGDEAARIVDVLPPRVRLSVMSHLRLVMEQESVLTDAARESTQRFIAQIRAGGLILTEREIGAISALVRDITGVDVVTSASVRPERTR